MMASVFGPHWSSFFLNAGGIVLLQLLDWLRMHFTEAYKIAGDCVSLEDAAEHPQYWQAVTQFVLQGSIEEARRLLAAHSNRTQPFQLLDQFLKNMPVFTVSESSLDGVAADSAAWQEPRVDFFFLPPATGIPRTLAGRV